MPGDDHVMICLEVLGVHNDEEHLAERIGEQGLLYNLHYPMNPEQIMKTGHDYAAVLQKKIDAAEYCFFIQESLDQDTVSQFILFSGEGKEWIL